MREGNKMKNENEVLVQEGNTPSDMIRLAVAGGADLEKLEKLLILQERYEANEARKAYNDRMVLVHQKMPIVGKTMKNEQTHSRYVSLDDLIKKTKEIYTEYGFSISFYEGETLKPEHIRICADVLHKLGHKETYYYDVPLDGIGIKGNANMTKIHAKASSTSYARRYLMCMIWNIPTGDDNDGNGVPQEVISDKELSQLLDMVADKEVNLEKFLEYMKIESLEKMPKAKFQQAFTAIQNKKKGGK